MGKIYMIETELGLALLVYFIAVLYLHNNNKELLLKSSNMLPLAAMGAYYAAVMLTKPVLSELI